MLFNEPSFFTQADSWNNGAVSAYTKANFKEWLKGKHQSIGHLNTLWHTNFKSFATLDIEIPMQSNLRGSPVWFDWMRFNQYRVTQWFTFLDSEIKKYDPQAKTHIKLMPWLWNTDTRDHGLDFESLLEITDIIGFDANSQYSNFRGVQPYEANFSFDWQSAAMSFDFFSSVQPEQLLWDSENHFFNNVKFQERDIDPDYVRAIYWLASTHGLAGSSTWLWGRNLDGSIISRKKQNSEFITEVTHQPIGLHSLTRTLMDINAHGADIQLLRKAPKSIRIFYSETSAINQPEYMTTIRETYQSLYFEGVALGFVSQNIINNQQNDWQVIVITNTPNVTTDELKALSRFAQSGGTIFIDNNSLLLNEYNQKHDITSYPKGKNVFHLTNLTDITRQINKTLLDKGNSPAITLTELTTPSENYNPVHKHQDKTHKTIAWRVVQRDAKTSIVSIVNTGHHAKAFSLKSTIGNTPLSILNLLTGNHENPVIKLGKRKTLLLRVTHN
nr:alpha-amylase family protein [Colwellia sp. C2M11]